MKQFVVLLLAVLLIGGIAYAWYQQATMMPAAPTETNEDVAVDTGADDRAMSDAGIDTEPIPADSIVGTWQSTDDPNFVRTIYENGGFTDSYEGSPDATHSGTWVTFTATEAPDDFAYPTEAGTTYLEMSDEDTVYTFAIIELSEESVTMLYLDRGGVLSFERIN